MALLPEDGADGASSSAPLSMPEGQFARPAVRHGRRGALIAAATSAVLGAVALLGSLSGSRGSGASREVAPSWKESVLVEAEDPQEWGGSVAEICRNYPKLEFVKCLHSNLALKGPDKGDEGMVFEARNANTGDKVEVVINAISSYTPFSPRLNGMSGEFASLNIKSGSSVKVIVSVRHPVTNEPWVEPYFALTFFDLDQGLSGTSQESVTVKGFKSYALSDDVQPGGGSKVKSEVEPISNPDGSKTFHSSTFGTGEDNPKHPDMLNQKQKNRAVSLRFRDFRSAEVTFAASDGLEPRFFTLVAYPALVCSGNYNTDRLANLKVGPSDTPVVGKDGDIFVKYHVDVGDQVFAGSDICSVKRDNQIHMYHAPVKGKVARIHLELKDGDSLTERLDDKTIAVISTHKLLAPLPTKPGDAQTVAPAGMRFKAFHVRNHAVVLKGDPIADITDARGQVTTLTASKSGPINARQAVQPGDSTDVVEDGNFATIGRFPKLQVTGESTATTVPPGCTFVRYLIKVGDQVSVSAPVAEIMMNGKMQEVQTPAAGTVISRQEQLLKGMAIDEAMEDRTIIVVGAAEKFPPLKVLSGQHPASVPPGMTFVSWYKDEGDIVKNGDALVDVRNPNGDLQTLAATGEGIVVARQNKLQPGMSIDAHMTDDNLMVIGKLAPLKVDAGEAPSNAPAGGYTFKDYTVRPGDIVNKGDTVAEVMSAEGTLHRIKASKYGKVKSRQEKLTEGVSIDGVMEDTDLLVVGRFPAVSASGLRQTSITAPPDAIFEEWYVEKNERVEAGQKIARISLPQGTDNTLRRLAAGFAGVSQDIRAPTWGTVSDMQPLKPNMKIGEQQEGPNIATLDQGPPWWLGLLFVLSVMGCCLCLLFGVMQKPMPSYRMMEPEEPKEPETPLIVEEPEPDGLRLDFQDGSNVRTVYAKRRPLGIKHNFVAPIVANDFTVNSYAKLELGVKEGWKLRRIGQEELHDNNNFDEVNGMLCDYMKDFELWPLPIDFRRSHNSAQAVTVQFRQRPIGIEFTNRAPIKVSKVYPGSPAQAANVEPGWYVTRIGEMDVSRTADFREVIGYFNEGVQPLDESGTIHSPR